MAKDEFHQGDVGVKIIIAVKDEKGREVSLSPDELSVSLKVKYPNGVESEWQGLEISEDGYRATYITKEGDLSQTGTYKAYPLLKYNEEDKIISGTSFGFTVVATFTDSV